MHSRGTRKLIVVTVNGNSQWVQLNERLENVKCLKLKYFKMFNCPVANFPEPVIYFDVYGLTSPVEIINHRLPSPWNATTSINPSSNFWPLQYRPYNQGAFASYTLEGKQSPCWKVENMRMVSQFQIFLFNSLRNGLAFDNETIAQFVFEVEFEGPNVLNPDQRVQIYSKHHN